MIDRIDLGVKFTPSADPPEFSRAPWWPVTLVFAPTQPETYNYSHIAKALETFFGLAFKDKDGKEVFPFIVRPQTVRMWGLAKQAINLEIYEILGKTHRVKQLADMGSGINFSRLGWRYGVAAQIDPNINEAIPLFSVTPNGKSIVYLQALIAVKAGFELVLKVSDETKLSRSNELSLDSMSLE